MPSRKFMWPGNAESDRRREVKTQSVFTDVFEDCPPTQVPPSALAKAINCWPAGTYARPRNGTKIFGIQNPPLAGREGYLAHKVGDQIISDSGNIFVQADVSNLWVWDNGLTDEMIEYVDAQHMNCRDDDYNAGDNCHIQGKVNLNQWHDKSQKWVVLLGNELWVANRDKTVYTSVLIFGRDLPVNSISEMIEDDNDVIIANAKYSYKVLLMDDPVRAYPINTPVPGRRIISNDTAGEKNHKYNYIYSCALFSQANGNFYHRETQEDGAYTVKMLTETGTNQIDTNRRDWATVNTEEALGPRADTYGRIVGGMLIAPWDVPGDWTGVSDLTFVANINALGAQEILVDATLISSFPELAERIQAALRLYFPSATAEYRSDIVIGPHFIITSGIVKGGSVVITEGITGTPSGFNLGITAAGGAVTETPWVGRPNIIRSLYLPRVQYILGTEYQWHHSHYPIYRTPDIGPDGVSDEERKSNVYASHLNVKGKRVVNSPDEFYWNKDLRVAASFYARRINGYIELRADELGGEFELADEGSVVEFEDGSRVEIALDGYINPKLVKYTEVDYYYEETEWMAAEIGNGRVMRVTQTGTIVTRVPGSHTDSYTAFTDADERKMVWFPNGVRDWIRNVIDADNVELYNGMDRMVTGMSLEPRYRNYCDAIYDETLFQRASGWMCKNRFMREVKPSNSIINQPGFVVFAPRGGKEIRYCPTEAGYKPFVGYHVREYQTIELEDTIERLVGFPNRFSVLCKGSIYSGATNNSIEYTIPETFQIIFILPGVDRLSKVGLIGYGGLDYIDDEWIRFVTNTGEVRDFNGIQFKTGIDGEPVDYSDDRATGLGRFKKVIQKAYKQFNAIYGRGVGWILWWKDL